jgi:predicted DNA-binding ribbon-helix-helix protein
MPDDFPTSVRFSKQLKADLKKWAKEQGCSVTWLVANLLERAVERRKEEAKHNREIENAARHTN